jgi:IclR family KDG regulon transcriptional repressor
MPIVETQSLIRAVAILDCFHANQPELGVREIARQLDLPHSTVGRLVATMHSLGVLGQNPTTRRYMLGPKVLAWGTIFTSGLDIRDKARPALEELHRATRETVNLYLLDGNERVCLDLIESPQRVRVVVRRGERMPLHAGSSGKAILAFMSPDLVKPILSKPLERMTPNTITNRRTLLKELESIRARGYATSHGERFGDALGLAAPIFDASGKVVAALNVAGPNMRFTDAEAEKYAPQVVQLAAQISQALGYTGSSPNLE